MSVDKEPAEEGTDKTKKWADEAADESGVDKTKMWPKEALEEDAGQQGGKKHGTDK